jgi:tetratricopeptide (TPR) repeat protein
MNRRSLVLVVVFALGIAVGALARGAKGGDPTLYRGKSKEEAAKALLEKARAEAGKGSWENIAVGRTYYLAGMKKEGQALFDSVTSKKSESSDWMRIGRVYYDAGEWEKAKEAFETALKKEPNDAKSLAEVGAYYNLKGDRAKAEELFDRSLKVESGEIWYTVMMAGSYSGIVPMP